MYYMHVTTPIILYGTRSLLIKTDVPIFVAIGIIGMHGKEMH